jgi:CheY-like chemotaxis protein
LKIVLASADLMVSARVEGVVRGLGGEMFCVSHAHGIAGCCIQEQADTLILDLKLPGLDVAETVARLHQANANQTTIIAFAPHVQEERLQAARQAGCDLVLTRGQIDRELETRLAEAGDRER